VTRPSEALADLEALAAGALPLTAMVRWTEGERDEDGTLTLPHPQYAARFDRIWAALAEAGFDPGARLDHIAWRDRFAGDPDDPATIAAMATDDLRHLAVRARRGERFCDGWWAGLLERGVLLAMLRRAEALRGAR